MTCLKHNCCEPGFSTNAGATAGGGTFYSNAEQSYTASCPEGYSGDPVTVTVAAGSFTATTQAEADALALNQATLEAQQSLVCTVV